ncbi:MAG: hypothetical protein RL189_1135 [Pseudomonadota bacterium]|jgi:hypothetical protein
MKLQILNIQPQVGAFECIATVLFLLLTDAEHLF